MTFAQPSSLLLEALLEDYPRMEPPGTCTLAQAQQAQRAPASPHHSGHLVPSCGRDSILPQAVCASSL